MTLPWTTLYATTHGNRVFTQLGDRTRALDQFSVTCGRRLNILSHAVSIDDERRIGLRRPRPLNQFHAAIQVLHDRGAAVDPIAAIDVDEIIHLPDGRRVDVPANCAVQTPLSHVACNRFLEVVDKADRALHLAFRITRQ